LFKTFSLGVILGLAGMYALIRFVPVVDQHREASHMSVQANGGNAESFYINLPHDRIMVGVPGLEDSVPAGLAWPQDEIFTESQAEIFKLRDRNDAVVGVASRMSSTTETTGAFIQWVLHLPARGTMFVAMQTQPTAEGFRTGVLHAGTQEFADLSGEIRERLLVEAQAAESDTNKRIQLVTALVGPQVDTQ
jgi:hypothetical protein